MFAFVGLDHLALAEQEQRGVALDAVLITNARTIVTIDHAQPDVVLFKFGRQRGLFKLRLKRLYNNQ